MSSRRKRKKHVEPEEHVNHERWLVSYADMLTVLVGLFIVLYAMSQVDQQKFEALAQSLNEGFGGNGILHSGSSILDTNSAPPTTSDPIDISTALRNDNIGDLTEGLDVKEKMELQEAKEEYAKLSELAEKIDEKMSEKGLQGMVSYKINDRGLVVGLVSDELFFVADTAELTSKSKEVIDTLSPVINGIKNEISVEGHANTLPSQRYKTNWELSSDRATQVLRRFVEQGELKNTRVSAVGYGDSRPIESNKTSEGLKKNRRVDVVILSDKTDAVRNLISEIAEGKKKKD